MAYVGCPSVLGKVCGVLGIVSQAAALTLADDSLIRPGIDTQQATQVQVVLEGEGQLLPPGTSSQAASKIPLKLKGEFGYVERALEAGEDVLSIRRYQQAAAEIQAGERTQKPQLAEHGVIAFQRRGDKTILFAPQGEPLTAEERELLEIPASSALLERLLPSSRVSVGGKWKLADKDLADLFHLQSISEQSVQGEFLKVEEGVAHCQLTGRFQGMSDGVLTEHQVEAKFSVSLPQQRVTWLALLIRESRQASAVRPGFAMTARLRVRRELAETPAELATNEMAQLQVRTEDPVLLLRPAHGEYELVYDARWAIMQDRRDKTILEYWDAAQSVAQCSITPLPDLPIGKTVTAEEFRHDIEAAIGQNLQQIVDARATTDERFAWVRVLATGQAQGVPIQWIYYHITNPQGRRAVVMFTLKQEDVSRLGGADLQLVHGLTFRAESEGSGDSGDSPRAASLPQVDDAR